MEKKTSPSFSYLERRQHDALRLNKFPLDIKALFSFFIQTTESAVRNLDTEAALK